MVHGVCVVPTICNALTDVQILPFRKFKTDIYSPTVLDSKSTVFSGSSKTDNLSFGIALY